MDDYLLFPRLLFGDARTTRQAWAKVVRAAWRRREWKDDLRRLEKVPVTALGNEVWISAMSLNPDKNLQTWRSYWIGEVTSETISKAIVRLPTAEEKRNATDHYDELLFEGMNHFWFVAGLLATGFGSFYLGAWERSRPNDVLVREYFSRFIHWLPELETMRPHFRHSLSGVVEDDERYGWAGIIASLCYDISGVEISNESIHDNYDGKISEALLECDIIEEHDGRYQLR